MGMSKTSMGIRSVDQGLVIHKEKDDDLVVALAGNPNVGKSTVFNQLTGLKQHTGNWPGKTVSNAQGCCRDGEQGYVLVDIPGCYSLRAHSAEEEVARDFICLEHPDAVIVVCDATCLERNMGLVLQILEVTGRTVVCVNLMDEAEKKGLSIDLKLLEKRLGVPVIGMAARSGRGLDQIFPALRKVMKNDAKPLSISYQKEIESAVSTLAPELEHICGEGLPSRWLAARLLEGDEALRETLKEKAGEAMETGKAAETLRVLEEQLEGQGFTKKEINDQTAKTLVKRAEEVCRGIAGGRKNTYDGRDRRLDRLFTSKATGFPIMLLMLMGIFWLTITGSNYPSELLSKGLFWIQDQLLAFFAATPVPKWFYEMLILGVYRVLAWVVSVMLPPMAIFFPLFTLLEDFGYLPRVAFNLDRCFQKCRACGKQALTMCMGFGCNAAGIVGCRIIDSPRERLIAMITNNFVPCNGRYPTMIAIISMFFLGAAAGPGQSLLTAFLLAGFIVLGILMTFAVSSILSRTILKGVPSSFTLELPPYRRPQIGKVIVRSIFDRTLFVLGRAAAVAAPAGLIIWGMANIRVDGATLLNICAGFLDPFAGLLGLDGVILMAFILGFPANEIVVPIIIMAYMAQGSLTDITDLHVLKQLLVDNGWTWVTAVCTMLFSLMHWPCSTTCLTIKKETQSMKWTFVSFLVPTITGILVCFVVHSLAVLLGVQ